MTHNFLNSQNKNCLVIVANLKGCVSEEILDIKFSAYGNIVKIDGSEPDYAIIEYEIEESALLAENETGSIVSGRKITASKVVKNGQIQKFIFSPAEIEAMIPLEASQTSKRRKNSANEIEIIVVSDKILPYAEKIEKTLKKLNIQVDVLRPNSNVPKTKIFGALADAGTLYAIIIEPTNIENGTLNFMTLQGSSSEFKNVPLKAAYKQIYKDYAKVCKKIKDDDIKHTPEGIRFILNLLINNADLTVFQYEKVLDFLSNERALARKIEENAEKPNQEFERYTRSARGMTCSLHCGYSDYSSESDDDDDDDDDDLEREEKTSWRKPYKSSKKSKKSKKEKEGDIIGILKNQKMMEYITRKIKKIPLTDSQKFKLKEDIGGNQKLKTALFDLRENKNTSYYDYY